MRWLKRNIVWRIVCVNFFLFFFMKSARQKTGFTLVELLVVIVIIGILATISIGTFQGYFAEARNAKRVSTVSNVSTAIKTRRATEESNPYLIVNSDVALLEAELNAIGLSLPNDNTQCYIYGWLTNGATEFFIAVADEEVADTIIVDGTGAGIAAAKGVAEELYDYSAADCASGSDTGLLSALTTYTFMPIDPDPNGF